MFREQVNTISSWFDQWNECERTVALYSLIKRVTHVNARFLSLVLDQTLGDSQELQLHEQQANSPGTALLKIKYNCVSFYSGIVNDIKFTETKLVSCFKVTCCFIHKYANPITL